MLRVPRRRGEQMPGGLNRWIAILLMLSVATFGCGDSPTEPPPNGSVGVVPQVGDTLRFFSAVQPDLSVDCQDTSNVVTGVVRDVGDGFALVEDVRVAGHFTSQDYSTLNSELDDVVFPVTTAYWGSPADLDGNERVIVLFTAEVNKLAQNGGSTFVAGFFWPGDLASRQQCPASNRAELLYILAPDPQGAFGPEISLQFARLNARGVVAHEFQHLLTAQQRVIKGGGTFADLEETWLSEGYAHIAEEVAGLAVANLLVGSNIGFNQAVANTDAFNAYQLQNFRRVGHFFLNPPDTRTIATQDPGGIASLRMRGFAWLLLRWSADQYVPANSSNQVNSTGASPSWASASSPLDVGELRIIRGAEEVRNFSLDGGSTSQRYLVAVQSADTIAGATTPMRLRVTPDGVGTLQANPRLDRLLEDAVVPLEHGVNLGEGLLKENMRQELIRRNAQPLRVTRQPALRSEGGRKIIASAEAEFFLELSRGNPGRSDGRGYRNLERALQEIAGQTVAWQDILAHFSSMPALTDTNHPNLPAETQVTTWNLRDMYNGLHNSNLGQEPEPQCMPFCTPYPLALTEIGLNVGGVVDFEINASAQKYFVLQGQAVTPNVTIELTTQNDNTLPNTALPQITVVRFQ